MLGYNYQLMFLLTLRLGIQVNVHQYFEKIWELTIGIGIYWEKNEESEKSINIILCQLKFPRNISHISKTYFIEYNILKFVFFIEFGRRTYFTEYNILKFIFYCIWYGKIFHQIKDLKIYFVLNLVLKNIILKIIS